MGVLSSDLDSNRLKYSNTLVWRYHLALSEGFATTDILQYIYPSDKEMERANLN